MFYIKRNDTSPGLRTQLRDAASDEPFDLTNSSVRFKMKKYNDGALKVNSAMTIVSADQGIVLYNWQTGDTDTAGTFAAEFEITFADGTIETVPNSGYMYVFIEEDL